MAIKVLQLVPRLPPEVCGVGDYSLDLAKQLQSRHQCEMSFLVGKPDALVSESIAGFPVHRLAERSATALRKSLEAIEHDVLILQYSGYGYDRRGAPIWLSTVVRRHARPTITMFHELFAGGPITSSAFWLSPVMKWIARNLAKSSRACLTNRMGSANWLPVDCAVMPTPSSMGELDQPTSILARRHQLAAFPYQAQHNPSYWQRLSMVLQELRPDRVYLLGKACSIPADFNYPVEQTGLLSATQTTAILRECRYGFLSYFPDYMGKSGILAALMAHGVCTIFADHPAAMSDGIEFGSNMLAFDALSAAPHEQIAQKGYDWYQPHSNTQTADVYFRKISEVLTYAQ